MSLRDIIASFSARHGRWRTVSANDGHVDVSLESRLLAFKSLGFCGLLPPYGGEATMLSC